MKMSRIVRVVLALLMITGSLVACGNVESYDDAVAKLGSPSPATPPSPAPPPDDPPPPPPPGGFGPNFSEIQANVFTPTCATAGCHAGAGAAAGLNLQAADSYAQLVGIASSQNAAVQRVAPGNPNNSYLIQKLEGPGSVGGQMPPSGALAQSIIDIIRQWITDGAIDDRVQASNPIRVTSLSPMPGANLSAAPTQIIAGFDRELDASTVNVNTFILEASGGDTTFGDGNELLIAATSLSVPGANPQTAVFSLSGMILADDTYRVRLLGSGASLIMDLDANALDGESVGTFPSGNGTAGGDFQATFAISTPIVIGPTLDQIQAVVFTPTCATAGCHTGPSGAILPSGLDLSDADASFAALVGVPSLQQAGILRVAATDPNNSYLIQKLEGNAATGLQMPFGLSPLDPAVIAEVRQWITDGALR